VLLNFFFDESLVPLHNLLVIGVFGDGGLQRFSHDEVGLSHGVLLLEDSGLPLALGRRWERLEFAELDVSFDGHLVLELLLDLHGILVVFFELVLEHLVLLHNAQFVFVVEHLLDLLDFFFLVLHEVLLVVLQQPLRGGLHRTDSLAPLLVGFIHLLDVHGLLLQLIVHFEVRRFISFGCSRGLLSVLHVEGVVVGFSVGKQSTLNLLLVDHRFGSVLGLLRSEGLQESAVRVHRPNVFDVFHCSHGQIQIRSLLLGVLDLDFVDLG